MEYRELFIADARKWLCENSFVNMDEPGTDVHFKSGFVIDFEQAMRNGLDYYKKLSPEILLKNGWIETPGIIVLKNPTIRLGWMPKNGTFIIGYGQLPRPITEVGELMEIYRLCGLFELANKFVL